MLVLTKMGRTGLLLEPRCRPQAGKSGYPHSQNADSSPRAQGTPGLGLAEKRRGKCEAPWAPTACGLGRRMADDWTLAARFPTTPRQPHDLTSPCMQKRVMITCNRGGRRLASFGYKYGMAQAIPVHLPLLLLFFFIPAARHPHGSAEEVLSRGERKGSPGRVWLPSDQAWPGPPSQAPYGPRCGFPWSWKQSSARRWAPDCR